MRNSMKPIGWMAGLLFVLFSTAAVAQDVNRPWEEYDKLVKTHEVVGTLGPTLFGDQVNLYNGALSFSATDISLPGNSKLPVALTRTFTVSKRNGYVNDAPMADWDLDLPNVSGVFVQGWGSQRCSAEFTPPSIPDGLSFFAPEDYWHGNQANLPGGGGGEMLVAQTGVSKPAAGGPYYWVTSGFTYFSCLPAIQNGTGEGFLAITSDGTKYWLDRMAQYREPSLKGAGSTSGQTARSKVVLYATRVEDRFGNSVVYTYNNAANEPARLISIEASDGRKITLGYDLNGHISNASDGLHTWTYQYNYANPIDPNSGTLTAVVLPDVSRWTINFAALSSATIRYSQSQPGGNDPVRSCGDPGDVITTGQTGTITHPSGAVGEFSVEPTRFGRSNVPMVCSNYQSPNNDPNDDVSYYPLAYDSFALTKKRITGPGLTAAEWNYLYYSTIVFWDPLGNPVCTSGDCGAVKCTNDTCAGTASVEVLGPDNEWTRYVFGNSYRYNEGKLLRTERGSSSATILNTETMSYELATTGQTFPTPIGLSPQPRGDGFTSEYLRPQRSRAVTQDASTFSNTVNTFDVFARPLSVVKSSSAGDSKTEVTAYYDDLSKWVLGQVKTVTVAGKAASQTDYDPATALPLRTYRFGLLQQTLGYNSDGTLATASDGLNQTTTLSNWYRGIPRLISHPDGTTESATVNDFGWLTAIVDELGNSTGYAYDVMGRLTQITPPAGDPITWNPTVRSFVPTGVSEYGLPAGHWKQSVSTGNGQTTTFYDAQWRPVLTLTEDTADVATRNFVVRRYDASGRETFVSYPVVAIATINDTLQGNRTFYDVLGRVVRTEQDSENGVLATTTEYLSGYRTRVTNPRGFQTTTSYQAFDVPSYDAPTNVAAPEGVTTTIARDVFGKPLQITRSGPNG